MSAESDGATGAIDAPRSEGTLDRLLGSAGAGAPHRAEAGGEGTGWPLRAPVVTRRLDDMRFDAARIDERRHELADLSLPAQEAGGLRTSEVPLAAYLAARAVDGRRVEGEDLTRLRKGHSVVVETRKAMSGGRGNVTQDIRATNGESTHRMFAGRDLSTDLAKQRGAPFKSIEESVAASEFVRAGNCGEFAGVAVHKAAGRLAAAESLHKVAANGVDHSFGEIRSAQGREHDVVMDPWANGPAILAPDGAFSGDTVPPSSEFAIGPADADSLTRTVAHHHARLLQRGAAAFVDDRLSFHRARGTRIHPGSRFAETDVIDERFATRVAQKMDTPVDLLARLDEPPTLVDTRVELRQEVHAAGAVRALGYGVKEAAENAASVAEAARRLTK